MSPTNAACLELRTFHPDLTAAPLWAAIGQKMAMHLEKGNCFQANNAEMVANEFLLNRTLTDTPIYMLPCTIK